MTNPNPNKEKVRGFLLALAELLEVDFKELGRLVAPPAPVVAPPREEKPNPEHLLDVNAVAAFLNCSASWVYKAAESGRLPCIRLGAMLRFDPQMIRRRAGLVEEPPRTQSKPPTPMRREQPMRTAAPRPPPPSRPMPAAPAPVASPLTAASTATMRPGPVEPRSSLSIKQAAQRLNLSTATLYKVCNAGDLLHFRVFNAIRILPGDLDQYALTRRHPGRNAATAAR